MNKQNLWMLAVALALIGGTAFGMNRLKTTQRLGAPGVKTSAISGSPRLNIYLPEFVLDYDSVVIPTDTNVLNGLPQDTSFMQRRYKAPKEIPMLLNVVLMGTDRTSIHKPQFCLTGSGWNIDGAESTLDTVRVETPHPYDLPVMKLSTTREVKINGEETKIRGIYVYWFVADHELTADHWTRMRKMATHLLRTGELQRWAYVSCFAVCRPGDEGVTYRQMKNFIASAVPQFQLANDAEVAGAAPPLAAAP